MVTHNTNSTSLIFEHYEDIILKSELVLGLLVTHVYSELISYFCIHKTWATVLMSLIIALNFI